MIKMNIVRNARKKQGITLRKLSEETCIPKWILRHYEWHYKDIMIDDLTILSEFLGFEIKTTKKQAHH